MIISFTPKPKLYGYVVDSVIVVYDPIEMKFWHFYRGTMVRKGTIYDKESLQGFLDLLKIKPNIKINNPRDYEKGDVLECSIS